jgi:hypothetical protein
MKVGHSSKMTTRAEAISLLYADGGDGWWERCPEARVLVEAYMRFDRNARALIVPQQ